MAKNKEDTLPIGLFFIMFPFSLIGFCSSIAFTADTYESYNHTKSSVEQLQKEVDTLERRQAVKDTNQYWYRAESD